MRAKFLEFTGPLVHSNSVMLEGLRKTGFQCFAFFEALFYKKFRWSDQRFCHKPKQGLRESR